MKPSCPDCNNAVEHEFHGGLSSGHCSTCGWQISGTANLPLFPDVRPSPVMAAKAAGVLSAAAMKRIREMLPEARRLTPRSLADQLASEHGLLVGRLQLFRAAEFEAELSTIGIRLDSVPHEDDHR